MLAKFGAGAHWVRALWGGPCGGFGRGEALEAEGVDAAILPRMGQCAVHQLLALHRRKACKTSPHELHFIVPTAVVDRFVMLGVQVGVVAHCERGAGHGCR